MKKGLLTMMALTMSMSLLIGCGGSGNADKGKDTAVKQEVNETQDADEEEFVDPNLELAEEPEVFLGYITEIEVTADNWDQYFHIVEETDEYGGEHASKMLYIYAQEGYYLKENIELVMNYQEKTTSTNTIPKYGPSTNVFNDSVTDKKIEVTSYSNRGTINSTYIYDETDDGVINELVIEISDIQCTGVNGKFYSFQIPEDAWKDDNGRQVVYLKYTADDGNEYAIEYENTEDSLSDLWEMINF